MGGEICWGLCVHCDVAQMSAGLSGFANIIEGW